MAPPRLIIASYLGAVARSPRGERTQALVRGLGTSWDVELLAGPSPGGGAGAAPVSGRGPARRRALRRRLGAIRDAVLVDRHEPWARRWLAAWAPEADLGLLVGPPFSFVAAAARRLAGAGVPYVLDLGDPWHAGGRLVPSALRARRDEQFAWSHAAGGIVTTEEQAQDVRRRFPRVPILVRPNGYPEELGAGAGTAMGAKRGPAGRLRLAHLGHVYGARVDIEPFLAGLAASGAWDAVELHVFGEDWSGALERLRRHVDVVMHAPAPWRDVIAVAGEYSAALAIGNHGGVQLPSKVIQYLTLPIPRLALVSDPAHDCIARYVADKPGWLVCAAADAGAAPQVEEHCSRTWPVGALAAPSGEAWPQVAGTIGAFLEEVRVGMPRA
jgi:hypothetical protein